MSVWNIAFVVLVAAALTFYPLLLGFVMWWSNQPPTRKVVVQAVEAEDQPAQARAEYPKAA